MQIEGQWTDEAVLVEIGQRLVRLRLDRELTQAQLAERAGVSKRTVERLEAGQSSQMSNLIRILRALGSLEGMNRLLPEATGPRPMDLLRQQKKKERKRASSRRKKAKDSSWQWGDES
ncbi:helix-turn-helix domain-containing protein [Planctomycetota bacterium]